MPSYLVDTGRAGSGPRIPSERGLPSDGHPGSSGASPVDPPREVRPSPPCPSHHIIGLTGFCVS